MLFGGKCNAGAVAGPVCDAAASAGSIANQFGTSARDCQRSHIHKYPAPQTSRCNFATRKHIRWFKVAKLFQSFHRAFNEFQFIDRSQYQECFCCHIIRYVSACVIKSVSRAAYCLRRTRSPEPASEHRVTQKTSGFVLLPGTFRRGIIILACRLEFGVGGMHPNNTPRTTFYTWDCLQRSRCSRAPTSRGLRGVWCTLYSSIVKFSTAN